MEFQDAVRTCLRKYITFSGRASRSEYWWFVLFCALVGFATGFAEAFINRAVGSADNPRLLSAAANVLLYIPSLAVGWRRLHDIGKPGYYSLYPWLVIVGVIFWAAALGANGTPGPVFGFIVLIALVSSVVLLLWWLTRPGQPGVNEYGQNPLGASAG